MKKLSSVLMFAVVFAAPVFAEKAYDHGNEKSPQMGGMMMNMMSHKQMMAMHEHMQKMQATMNEIRQEPDPDKRHRLMKAHMEQMQTGMQMMSKGEGKDKSMQSMNMEDRMGMMENHMGMMQMMMGQMMEHKAEETKQQKHNKH